MLENLRGSYEEERIATMAVSIDIKKELEAKLYPTYADRLELFIYVALHCLNICMQ